jgi:hypothetical protein
VTITEFRNDPALRAELLSAIQNPALALAIDCIVREDSGVDAKLNADAIVSVRMASQRAGRELAFKALYDMTVPIPLPEAAPKENFGTPFDESVFDPPQPEQNT